MGRSAAASLPLLCTFLLAGCSHAPASGYTPGLGEFMAATQMRHTKLWFAGRAGNWRLASYELDELQEGFDDAVRFNPVHKGAPVPVAELLPRITAAPMQELRKAVAHRNKSDFRDAFDTLTAACNTCHRAENYGFNVVTRPTSNPYTDQVFSR